MGEASGAGRDAEAVADRSHDEMGQGGWRPPRGSRRVGGTRDRSPVAVDGGAGGEVARQRRQPIAAAMEAHGGVHRQHDWCLQGRSGPPSAVAGRPRVPAEHDPSRGLRSGLERDDARSGRPRPPGTDGRSDGKARQVRIQVGDGSMIFAILALACTAVSPQDKVPPKTLEERLKELEERLGALEKRHKVLADENQTLEKRLSDAKAAKENFAKQSASGWVRQYARPVDFTEKQSAELEELWLGWVRSDFDKPADGAAWKSREEAIK